MANELQIFENEEFGKVRTVEINGKVYFVARDIAKSLGYAVPQKAVIDHCKGVLKWNIPTKGGIQAVNIIPEGDVYRLIIHSKLPAAERFESWVFDEVLPTIHRTGSYTPDFMTKVDNMIKGIFAAKEVIDAQNVQIKQLTAENQAIKPKAIFADAILASPSTITISELAKILRQNDISIGPNRLLDWLRDNGYLLKSGYAKNMPTQAAIERGLFQIEEGYFKDQSGVNILTKTVKVTSKGQWHFIRRFLRDSILGGHDEV